MARLIDENLEPTTPNGYGGTGYEENWSETVDVGNTLDEDAAIPGTPPAGSGSQCLKAIFTAGAQNAYAKRTIGNTNINYIRSYLYMSEEGLNDNQVVVTSILEDSALNPAARIVITQSTGVLKMYFEFYSNGALLSTDKVNMSLNTWYRIEYKYDLTNMLWEIKVDGVSQTSGSLLAPTRTPYSLLAGGGHDGSAQSTLYTDLVVWDDATWPGEEAGRLPIPVALGRNILGRGILSNRGLST